MCIIIHRVIPFLSFKYKAFSCYQHPRLLARGGGPVPAFRRTVHGDDRRRPSFSLQRRPQFVENENFRTGFGEFWERLSVRLWTEQRRDRPAIFCGDIDIVASTSDPMRHEAYVITAMTSNRLSRLGSPDQHNSPKIP